MTKQVALLRGINVGGKNRVEMPRLRQVFESLGFTDVSTYINSGNVLYKGRARKPAVIEQAIEQEFGLSVPVLVRTAANIAEVAASLPDGWASNRDMRCDVLFLWSAIDTPDVLDTLVIKPFDDVRYAPGAILWRVDRSHQVRSGMQKLLGTRTYKQMTIRNCNTARALHAKLNG